MYGFFAKLMYNEYIRPYLLSHVVFTIFTSGPPKEGLHAYCQYPSYGRTDCPTYSPGTALFKYHKYPQECTKGVLFRISMYKMYVQETYCY